MESGSGRQCEPPLRGKESPSLPAAVKKLYCGEPLALGATLYGIAVILFLFHTLLILISFFISVLGCVTLCHGLGNYDTLTTVVVYQTPDAVAPAVPSPSKEVEAP